MFEMLRVAAAGLLASDQLEPASAPGLSQEDIESLPTIHGVRAVGDDSTARVDRAGYVYLWEPAEDGLGFWVQAGYVRNGRQRPGQAIDAGDIQWFELRLYKKRVQDAKRSVHRLRMPTGDDIRDAAEGEFGQRSPYLPAPGRREAVDPDEI